MPKDIILKFKIGGIKMAIKMHVRTGDQYCLSGKDKGKKGKVLSVNP